jgi:DNA-binding protein HU-beta
MFGFSLGKLLLLAVIVAVVWYGFKLYERKRSMRELRAKQREKVVDLVRNPQTGAPIQIKASKKVAFRAAKELKEAV